MERALSYLHTFKLHQEKQSVYTENVSKAQEKWPVPNGEEYKINVDGAFGTEQNGTASIGVIIRNCMGEIMVSMAAPMSSAFNSTFLEALAVSRGFDSCPRNGFNGVYG